MESFKCNVKRNKNCKDKYSSERFGTRFWTQILDRALRICFTKVVEEGSSFEVRPIPCQLKQALPTPPLLHAGPWAATLVMTMRQGLLSPELTNVDVTTVLIREAVAPSLLTEDVLVVHGIVLVGLLSALLIVSVALGWPLVLTMGVSAAGSWVVESLVTCLSSISSIQALQQTYMQTFIENLATKTFPLLPYFSSVFQLLKFRIIVPALETPLFVFCIGRRN